MPETLRLEFTCTDAEKRQAQSLHLRRQVGGGSKLMTTVVLLLMLTGMLLGFYFRVRREVSAPYRPYVYAGTFGVALFAWFRIRRARSVAPAAIGVDVSDDGLSVGAAGSEVRMPWSAFGRLLESDELFVLIDRPGTTLLTIPRRAFPDESRQDWFHTLANNRLSLAEPPPADAPAALPSDPSQCVRVRLHLRYRDYLDSTLASWLTRALFAGFAALVIGTFLRSAANPPPNAAFSTAQLFFMLLLPFLLVMMTLGVVVFSVRSWWLHSRAAVPQELSLSPDSIAFSGADGSGTLPWSTYDRFKETRWSFLIWNTRSSAWMLLPKRAFGSGEDVTRCRDILSEHLQRSSWFFG